MTTDELREAFLDFFATKGCERRPSDVLVPRGDDTVLFTPAGMNQFKREFMGVGDPMLKRAATCQMCIRTGDIENVGKTPRHMTFFEMLGNFSFGDYFKREAIHWAWEFLTKTVKVDPRRITITVYLDDDEAFDIWNKEIGLAPDRITRMGEDDNFWPAGAPTHGPNGVCGPCSEIFYHGDGIEEVEIWNLVFTQFNRVGVGQLEPLPSKNIDTGMGLERMAAALQGVKSNYEIDIFKPLVAAAADVLGIDYAKVAHEPDGVRVRRISDHVRTLAFTIHENVTPSNEKQGYVVRRLLRRAVLDAYRMGRREPFLHQIVPAVAQVMGRPYPELRDSVSKIQNVVKEEEEQFLRNLDRGLKRLDDVFKQTKAAGSDTIGGPLAFELHATHGIWVEITEALAAEQDLRIDRPGFEAAMKDHAATSRGTTEAAAVFTSGPLDALKQAYHHGSNFVGYETTTAEAAVIGIIAQNRLVESEGPTGDGPPIAVVLDKTPFYGESGGQVGDKGMLTAPGIVFEVIDTHKQNDFTLHLGRLKSGTLNLEAKVTATVDRDRRQAIRRAHSATHVLHAALHEHLGKHAQQAGSKVEPDRLRFDFSNPEAVGRDRLKQIEQTANEHVLRNDPIRWVVMPIAQAKSLGAMALFGEKYPENVRVVTMGEFSRELCGGTHLDTTGEVGLFRIVGEESVSAGTRRITALTGRAALYAIRQEQQALAEVASVLKVPATQAATRVAALLEEVKALKKQSGQKKEAPAVSADDLIASACDVGGTKVVAKAVEGVSPDDLRQLIDVARRKAGTNLAILLITANEGKVTLAAGLTPDLVQHGKHAGNWLKPVAAIVGGGGGGRPDFAQAGGKDPSKIAQAIEAALAAFSA